MSLGLETFDVTVLTVGGHVSGDGGEALDELLVISEQHDIVISALVLEITVDLIGLHGNDIQVNGGHLLAVTLEVVHTHTVDVTIQVGVVVVVFLGLFHGSEKLVI